MDEQRRILTASLASDNPAVKYGTLLSILRQQQQRDFFANAAEFKLIGDVWWRDTRGRVLKTGDKFRGWLTPFHPAVTEAGFLEYLATRKGKRLFDGSHKSIAQTVMI
jgi:hypothetical protein